MKKLRKNTSGSRTNNGTEPGRVKREVGATYGKIGEDVKKEKRQRTQKEKAPLRGKEQEKKRNAA